MREILVASKNQDACNAIRRCFGEECRVEVTVSKGTALEMFQKKRYEFTFIDVEFLMATSHQVGKNDYRTALQPFWQAFPSAE